MFQLPIILAIIAAAQDPTAAEKDRKMLQGQWEVVSMVQGGKDVPGLKEGKIIFAFHDGKLTVKVGDKVLNEGACTFDAGKTPRTIDLKDDRDTIQGIYELTESEVKLCMGARGAKARPTEFTAPPGTDQSLVILKRVKK